MRTLAAIFLGLLAVHASIIQASEGWEEPEGALGQATPIPAANPGFPIGATSPTPSRVDIFMDPHCPACVHLVPDLKGALDTVVDGRKLREQIEVNLHYLPLPFHPFSFSSIVALKFLEDKYPTAVLSFLEIMAANQAKFNEELWDTPLNGVRDILKDLVKQVIPKDAPNPFVFTSAYLDAARLSFKYVMAREVNGSPTVLVNNMPLDSAPSSASQWVKVLGQYLH